MHLSVSVQAVGRLSRARAAMYVIAADGQMLEQIDSDEIIESPDRIGGALARDLVARLARSPRPAEYADSIYGRRLRPLRDTVGRHAAGREDHGDGMPPSETLNLANKYGVYDTTLRGRTELAPPVEAPEPVRAAARERPPARPGAAGRRPGARRLRGIRAGLSADDDAEPLFGLAESLLRAGAAAGRADLLSRVPAQGRARLAPGGAGGGADERDRGSAEALRTLLRARPALSPALSRDGRG